MARYFWLVAIIGTTFQAFIIRYITREHVEANPRLAKGYAKLIRGYVFWFNIPWVVMGIGCTVGGVPTVFHYFQPRDGNPFVLAWWAVFFALYIIGAYWIFFSNGAHILTKYKWPVWIVFTRVIYAASDPTVVKLVFLLWLVAGAIFAIVMWTIDIPPLPPLPW